MGSVKNGGPAFPGYRAGETFQRGLSLRDYFASHAMIAEIISSCSDATPLAAEAFAQGAAAAGHTAEQHIAANAYRIADAMLKARKE